METFIHILIIIILIVSSGYFSGSEAALFSLPSSRIKVYQGDSDPRKRLIASLLLRPRDLLVTVFMLNTFVNILLQNSMANLFGDASSWALKVGVPLVLTLIFGEIIPKYIGLQNNLTLSYVVAPTINFFQKMLKPIRKATLAITVPLSHFMFFYLKKEEEISEDEIQHILKTSAEHGVFNADEGELIAGYVHLQNATVHELMWPREDILSYDLQEPLSKLTYLFVDREVSRIPICDSELDNMQGILTAKQFFLNRDNIKTAQDIIPLMIKPFYVPESMPARMLLHRFHEQNQVLALVVDEYGSISGLVTREDLFEVVIGDIADLRDETELYSKAGPNEIIASAKLELDQFNDLFNVELTSSNNMLTLGGWLIEKLGEIPKIGSQFELEGFLFKVLAATQNRITRLYIRKNEK